MQQLPSKHRSSRPHQSSLSTGPAGWPTATSYPSKENQWCIVLLLQTPPPKRKMQASMFGPRQDSPCDPKPLTAPLALTPGATPLAQPHVLVALRGHAETCEHPALYQGLQVWGCSLCPTPQTKPIWGKDAGSKKECLLRLRV